MDLESLLHRRFGYESFKSGQREAVEAALEGRRVLLIQPTGWGKSLVYQMLAAIRGFTLVFSPLRALMRDQVDAACARYGLRAEALNSDLELEEQQRVLKRARTGELDLLFIAPERLANSLWQECVPELPIRNVVIDEAHCISVWGHDFRPDYRRIINLVRTLPGTTPVLAVTATATPRVEEDILAQIGHPTFVIRGPLSRPNFRLRVLKVAGDREKLAWLGHLIPQLPGSGIVYTATQSSAELAASFLQAEGIVSAFYHAGLAKDERKAIEQDLIENRFKVVTSTNALGMGIDKPDLRFIIHYEMPGSPLQYYQEIGRAGRDGQPAGIVLLYDPEDVAIQRSFIHRSKPSADHYQQVYRLLHVSAKRESDLQLETGLSQTSIRNILYDLQDQEIVARDSSKYYRVVRPKELDFVEQERLRRIKEEDLDALLGYIATEDCRMAYLCKYLGDGEAHVCGCCDHCKGKPIPYPPEPLFQRAAQFASYPRLHLRAKYLKSPLYEDGFAIDYYAGTRVGNAVHASKYEAAGAFPGWLIEQAAALLQEKYPLADLSGIVAVPPSVSGGLVEKFVRLLAQQTGLTHHLSIRKIKQTETQKGFTNRLQKRRNLKDAFACETEIHGDNLLVIDDIFDSGVTMEEVGKVLKRAGAGRLYPLTLAKTRHSDDV